MKKNYIAPSTVAATWASMGLMQGIGFAFNAGSGTTPASAKETNDVNLID